MKIKKGDIFDVYKDGQPTRRCIAEKDSFIVAHNLVYCKPIDGLGMLFTSPIRVEDQIEKVICNINDLEEISEKAWMYDDLDPN